MASTFFHDIAVMLVIGKERAEFETVATIKFTCTRPIPATWDDPPEGGEVQVLKVLELFIPAKKGGKLSSPTARVTLDCPQWLEDAILADVDSGELAESVDWSDDYE
jgi:hypothetical protein